VLFTVLRYIVNVPGVSYVTFVKILNLYVVFIDNPVIFVGFGEIILKSQLVFNPVAKVPHVVYISTPIQVAVPKVVYKLTSVLLPVVKEYQTSLIVPVASQVGLDNPSVVIEPIVVPAVPVDEPGHCNDNKVALAQASFDGTAGGVHTNVNPDDGKQEAVDINLTVCAVDVPAVVPFGAPQFGAPSGTEAVNLLLLKSVFTEPLKPTIG
jgi:hypothetical protein